MGGRCASSGWQRFLKKDDARRTMELTHDHTFTAVDNEATVFGHEWHFAEIDIGFSDIYDVRFICIRVGFP